MMQPHFSPILKFPLTLVARATGGTLAVLLTAGAALFASAGVADARSDEPPARPKLAAPGTVVSAAPLKRQLWVPRTTRSAFALKYVTTNAFGHRALSTGTVFLPKGKMPRGGWPVISYAHGSVGIGDKCAPSRVGSAFPEFERPYLAHWMRQGYAIVATDYVGLGTPGLFAANHGRSEAHSVVDMVKAARHYVGEHRRRQRLARKWAVVGQSQGGAAAMFTARYATQFDGRRLDYRGAVGTGVPAYVERVLSLIGPNFPPAPLPPTVTANGAYMFAGLRYAHPELGIDRILTPVGRRIFEQAESKCVIEFAKALEGVNAADGFSRPVASLPGWEQTLRRYMALPESGFDRPLFIGHGRQDESAPYGNTAEYVSALEQNGEPVTFKAYDNDHLGTMLESQRDSIPFVRGLFAGKRG
jgi:hypothetical protein